MNRTGAQGDIAMAAVARAAADGYTLALMPVGNAAVNPSLIPYDPVKEFAPIMSNWGQSRFPQPSLLRMPLSRSLRTRRAHQRSVPDRDRCRTPC
jgi:Tripartite tricarboxylate transporter family receptor